MKDVLNIVSAIGALAMAATPLVGVASAAHAEQSGYRAQHIHVADLDLSRADDVARFDARVDAAADRICGQEADMNVLSACRTAVREEAAEQVDALRAQPMQSASVEPVKVAGR